MKTHREESRLITRTEASRITRKARKTITEWVLLGYITEFFLYSKNRNKKNVYGYVSEAEVLRVSQMTPTQRKGTRCKRCSNLL